MEPPQKIKKPRKRIPISCRVCRKRKIKCDRGRPFCESCVQNGTTNMCIYDEQLWELNSSAQQQAGVLESQNRQLVAELSELKSRIRRLEGAMTGPTVDDTYSAPNSNTAGSTKTSVNSGRTSVSESSAHPSMTSSASHGSSNSSSPDEASIAGTSESSPQSSIGGKESYINFVGPHYAKLPAAEAGDVDSVLDLARKFDSLFIKYNRLVHFGATSWMAVTNNDPFLSDMLLPFIKNMKSHYMKTFKNDTARGFSACPNEDVEDPAAGDLLLRPGMSTRNLIDTIEKLLPRRTVCDALVSYFFEACYPLYPFLDEELFRQEISFTFSVNTSNDRMIVNDVEEPFPFLALYLIVLRIAFMNTSVKLDKHNATDEWNQMVSHQCFTCPHHPDIEIICKECIDISPAYVDLAKLCLSHCSILRKVSFKLVQCLLFLRMYRIHAPEDGDEGFDSNAILSIAVRMAIYVGLHRDPSQFEFVEDERIQHLWRKVWYQLLFLDSVASMNFGAPLSVPSDDIFDIRLPFLIERHKNNNQEKKVIEYMRVQYSITKVMRAMMNQCTNIVNPPRRSDLEKQVVKLQQILNDDIPSFHKLMEQSSGGQSMFEVAHYASLLSLRLITSCIIYLVYYILYLSCDSGETVLARRYSSAALHYALNIFQASLDYSRKSKVYFGGNFENYVLSNIYFTTMRALQLICSLCIRSRMGLYSFKDSKPRFISSDTAFLSDWNNVITVSEEKARETLLGYVNELFNECNDSSKTRYRSWKVAQIVRFFLNYFQLKFTNDNGTPDLATGQKGIPVNNPVVDLDLLTAQSGLGPKTSASYNAFLAESSATRSFYNDTGSNQGNSVPVSNAANPETYQGGNESNMTPLPDFTASSFEMELDSFLFKDVFQDANYWMNFMDHNGEYKYDYGATLSLDPSVSMSQNSPFSNDNNLFMK